MSWSLSTELTNDPTDMFTDNKVQRLRKTFEEMDKATIGNSHCTMERDHQIDAAINAAGLLLVQGGFVQNADVIGVSLSGHANPDHKAADGWANETITVNIWVKSYRPEEPQEQLQLK